VSLSPHVHQSELTHLQLLFFNFSLDDSGSTAPQSLTVFIPGPPNFTSIDAMAVDVLADTSISPINVSKRWKYDRPSR
jgi:hypothetical protein